MRYRNMVLTCIFVTHDVKLGDVGLMGSEKVLLLLLIRRSYYKCCMSVLVDLKLL